VATLELEHAFHLAGALATLLRGGLALAWPLTFARRNGLAPTDALGRSELRATHGALLTALGGFAVFAQDQVAFALLGGAWVAAACVRVGAALLASELDARVWRAALRDGAFAVLLLYPG
jgi:hypothetical protein